MSLRKLASIQRVLALSPIDGADRIEVAQVNGWNCVVKKGEFAVGDLAVFFEIDAVPPDVKLWSWLWQPSTPPEVPIVRPGNFRIRTKKLRGVVSQGLLQPLSVLQASSFDVALTQEGVVEDSDVTEFLGVTKYETPEFSSSGPGFKAGRRASNFPTRLVKKTDEQRIQSATRLLWELAGKPWVATLKLDGTSATYVYDNEKNEVLCCSRNYVVKDDPENGKTSLYVDIAKKHDLLQSLADPSFQKLAFQGEIVGPGIQGNKLGLAEPELRIFRVYNTETRRPVTQAELEKHCGQLGLAFVDVVASRDYFAPQLAEWKNAGEIFSDPEEGAEKSRAKAIGATKLIKELLALAEGVYAGTKNQREGIVIRPRDEVLYSEKLGDWLSFKCISNAFLLKEKD